MALSLNGTVTTVVALAITLVVIGSVLAPIAQDVMDQFTHETGGVPDFTEGATWASLVGCLVLFSIIGLLIVAVNGYTNGKK